MAYGYNNQSQSPQMQNQGWGGLQPTPPISPYSNTQPHYPAAAGPTPVIDAAALTPELQPAYQDPQFAPLPPAPKPPKPPNNVLNFFSFRPSFQQQVNTGESSLSVHGSPPVNAQQYGVQLSPVAPAGYVQPSPSPMPVYNPLAPVGQPGQVPIYQPSPPVFQQPQPQQQHYQQQPVQQHPQPQPHPQPQHPQHPQPHQQPLPPQQQHQQQQPPPQQPPHQHPQPQHPQQQHQQQPQSLPPHQSQPYTDHAAPPPAYTQGSNAGHKWPEKPTIQSNYAAAPATPATPTAQAVPPAPAAPPATQTPHPPANTQPKPQSPPDDTRYWALLVSQGTIPLAPKPQLRSLFRGIAACIIRECTVDVGPSCVLSPAQLSMYYGQYSGYGSRSARLFSHAQTAPHALRTLYAHLAVEYVLIPSDPGDGRRKPDMPALTIRGFEYWLLLTALLDPDREHARLAAFIAAPGRRIQDDNGNVFPAGGFPRAALPPAPDAFVCRRYGGYLEEALSNEDPPEKDAGWRGEIEALKKSLHEREKELEKSNSEVDALRKLVAKQTAAADEAVTKMSASVGIVQPGQNQQQQPQQQQQHSEQRPPQNPQNNPFVPYQQQQQQYPPQSPHHAPPTPTLQQQYQHPPQPQRRQSEQPYPQDHHQPQRRQTEQTVQQQQPQQPQQRTYSRPTYQPQR